MPLKKSDRSEVFVSYSHKDKKWLERLQVHLKPLERSHKVVIWSDTKLRGGDRWLKEIEDALSRAKVAILLISADFLASDFIHSNELPPLLKASENAGLVILPIIIGRCAFIHSPISQFQAINEPAQPLNSCSDGQIDEVLFQLYGRVYSIFDQPTKLPKTSNTTISPPKKIVGKKLSDNINNKAKTSESSSKIPVSNVPKKIPVVKKPASTDNSLLVKKNGEWEVIPIIQFQVNGVLDMILRPTTAVQKAFLTSLRQSDNLLGIVFRFQTYICKMQSLTARIEARRETWHLTASRQEINHRTEMTYNGINPDMQAEAQAKLILLNEVTQSTNQTIWGYRGSYLSSITESPLPTLYKMLSRKATTFATAAPLVATWYMQLNNVVEHILKLRLTLKGKELNVQFEGQRREQYQDSPYTIRVTGVCDLSRPASDDKLKLGPFNRY